MEEIPTYKQLYKKYDGKYEDLVREHIKILKELQNCRELLGYRGVTKWGR